MKDRSVEITLNAETLKNSIARDNAEPKYLLDVIAEKIDDKERQVLYSSVAMKYAYGHIPLDENTAKHCSFQIIDGKSSSTYPFLTRHYGLAILPTELLIVIDLTLVNTD